MHVDRELTKTSLRIKKKFRVSFSPEDYLLFLFRERFFPKHALSKCEYFHSNF